MFIFSWERMKLKKRPILCMDCSGEFIARLASESYTSFEKFSQALRAFEEVTCTKYMKRRSKCFPEHALERTILVYRAVEYVCSLRGSPETRVRQRSCGTECNSNFTLRYRHGVLRVIRYDMVHNHDKNTELISKTDDDSMFGDNSYLGDAAVDLKHQFANLFKPMCFSTFQELHENMETFQRMTGSLYVMRSTRRFPEGTPERDTLVYRSLVFECYHYGTHASSAKQRPHQRTSKIGCRSKINISCKENRLVITKYEVRHNHEVTPQSARLYPKNRRLDKVQEVTIRELLKSNPENHTVKDYIEDNFGISVTLYDIKNLKKRFKEIPETPPLSQPDMFSHINLHLQQLEEVAMSASSSDRFWARLNDMAALADKWRSEENPVSEIPNSEHLPICPPPNFECTEVTSPSIMHYEETDGDEDGMGVIDDLPSGSTTYYPQMHPPTSSLSSFENQVIIYRDGMPFRPTLKPSQHPVMSKLTQFRGTWTLIPPSVKSENV